MTIQDRIWYIESIKPVYRSAELLYLFMRLFKYLYLFMYFYTKSLSTYSHIQGLAFPAIYSPR